MIQCIRLFRDTIYIVYISDNRVYMHSAYVYCVILQNIINDN